MDEDNYLEEEEEEEEEEDEDEDFIDLVSSDNEVY